MDRISVDAKALHAVLQALVGPDHHIRELQFTRGIPGVDENPIDTLIIEYNEAVQTQPQNTQDN